MPDPSEKLVESENRRRGILYWVGRAAIFSLGLIISLIFIFSGISTLESNNVVVLNIWSKYFKEESGRDLTIQPESVGDIINRLCAREGRDYISECQQLSQRLCNQPAMEQAIRKLSERNDYISASKLGSGFLERCDRNERIGLLTAQAYFHLTEFEAALAAIEMFPEEANSYPDFASWHGFILEKLGRFDDAAERLNRALHLFPDLSKVGVLQFYHVTRVLKSAGRFCDALVPLQEYTSFDAERMTEQISQEIDSLRTRGNCV